MRVTQLFPVLAALVRCSPFGAADATEDRAPTADGGPRDAASSNDAGDPRDGGAPDAEQPPAYGAFCQAFDVAPTFCADFDAPRDPELPVGWTSIFGGATLSFDETVVSSAPRSLHASGAQGGLEEIVALSKSIAIDADVFYPTLPTGTGALAAIDVAPTTGSADPVAFEVEKDKAYFQQGNIDADSYSATLTKPAIDRWHHVTIVLSIAADDGSVHVRVAYDGQDVAWTDNPLRWPARPTSVRVHVGIAELRNVTSGEALVDNVVLRAD